jgi:hypothetical protein
MCDKIWWQSDCIDGCLILESSQREHLNTVELLTKHAQLFFVTV